MKIRIFLRKFFIIGVSAIILFNSSGFKVQIKPLTYTELNINNYHREQMEVPIMKQKIWLKDFEKTFFKDLPVYGDSPVKYGHSWSTMDKVEYIVIHDTANKNATAENHQTYLNTHEGACAAHIYVDDKDVYQMLPLNYKGWHSGNYEMNSKSIGIEICVFENKERQDKALENAKKVIQTLKLQFVNAEIIYHKDVTGKKCPQLVFGENPVYEQKDFEERIGFNDGF